MQPSDEHGQSFDAPETQETDVGADVLDEVYDFLGRFVVYPSEHAHVAHTLWVAHTHLMDAWESTPRLAFLSPEPSSGKTRALEITETLVPKPVEAVNVTPAYLFRKVGDPEGAPTVLFDEVDTVFGPKARDNEEIRGLLNAGHRRGAVAGRCMVRGKTIETEEIPAYCALALAGIGNLPDTILTRSVVVRMRRRAPNETVQSYRRRIHAVEGNQIRDRLVWWCASIANDVTGAWPTMPDGIEDRDADVWESLLAVADAAGGDWPERARVSAVSLVSLSRQANPSLGVQLLEDIRFVFDDRNEMFTDDLVNALNVLEEAPWGDLKGKALDGRRLAWLLRQYDVRPKQVRIGTVSKRGYTRESLWDAWERYLPCASPGSETPETNKTDDDVVVDLEEREAIRRESGGGAA